MPATLERNGTANVTIHAVALPPQTTIPILDAAEVSGFGFRQYPSVESLLDGAAPSSVGCVLISCGDDVAKNSALVWQLKAHFYSLPLVVLLNSESADEAVDLMQQGVFSVLTQPPEPHKLLATISAAVDQCVTTQSAVDGCREASLRMREATEKEVEVLELIMQGFKNKEIAGQLGITVRAIEDRRFRLMRKVGVDSVAELVTLAVSARYFDQGLSTGSLRNPVTSDPKQCVKGIEIWVPTADDSQLVLQQSCYRDAVAFEDGSQGITFRRGKGLPGRVWERRAPAFLKELITTEFVRSTAAGVVGMTTAVGVPVFCEGHVHSIVLILLDTRHQMKAAVESWRLDPQTSTMRLAGGTYVNCEKLRRLTEFVQLPVGEGLAGCAAKQARPYLSSQFSDDSHAVRGLALSAEQLISGVALPLTDSGSVISDVFLLFNSETTPMFSLLQSWKPSGNGVKLTAEVVDGVPSLAPQMPTAVQSMESCLAGRATLRRGPVVVDNGSAANDIVRGSHAARPSLGIAIPTLVAGRVVAVTVMAN